MNQPLTKHPSTARLAAPSMAALARHPLALTQDQLLTRAQLVALGCADSTTSHRCRPGGPWQRVLPRVHVLHSGTPTPRQRMRAALLYAGECALLTGLAALSLHNFRAAPRPERLRHIDVLVPYEGVGARGTSFVRVHRTRRMPENFPVAGLGVAEIARAVADAVPGLTCERDVTALLAEAVQRGFCTPEALLAELGASHRRYAPYVARATAHLAGGRALTVGGGRPRADPRLLSPGTPLEPEPPRPADRHVPGPPGRVLAGGGPGPGGRLP
ncbi:PqqD family protein [Streptomyces sp. NBC_00006]|uniref:hypothetical protein n=1 Tax=Streptomyces sp. NBC_00006 TaxID=2975619 RepID=UPI00225ABD64|nr:hypothetical protein [Streptomyces sp. NBC_00006]MCX5533308.1 PqqD family protein [Streptomyces sp. NBC_00006]